MSSSDQERRRWRVHAVVTVSLNAFVEASSEEEAIDLAGELTLPSLCYQCSGGGDPSDETWSLSGELDGEPQDIEATLDDEE